MVRVFLLYLLGVYLFANGGQTVSLRWLALFRDFVRARTANWGSVCLAYFYSSLETLSRVTLHQLVGPWKLLEVSFSPFSLVAHAFSSLWSYSHMPSRLRPYTIFLLTAFIPITSCKLSYLNLANCHLENCTISSCKLSSLLSARPWSMVSLLGGLRWIWRMSPRFGPISTGSLLMI